MNQVDDLMPPVVYWIPKAEQFCIAKDERPFVKAWEPLYTADQMREYAKKAVEAEREAQPKHQDWCASLTQMLMSMPPKPAPCNCKPEQAQPVAWLDAEGQLYVDEPPKNWCPPHTPLYTTPPHRQPLSEQEINEIARHEDEHGQAPWHLAFARAIEAAHGITGDTK